MENKKMDTENGSVEKAKPDAVEQNTNTSGSNPKGQSKISRLGGGYGGLQHEQYPNENGYSDSGDLGEVEEKPVTK